MSYFQDTCTAIGLNPSNNFFTLKKFPGVVDGVLANEEIKWPLLAEDESTGDIIIPVYDLDGSPCIYDKNKNTKTKSLNAAARPFEIRRYTPDRYAQMCTEAEKQGKEKPGKYKIPSGAKTFPWISPNIMHAFKFKEPISTIIITEGYKKAIAGFVNGLFMFGLSSISTYADKDYGTLHPCILDVIKDCKVQNVVLLYDGDCADISLNALNNGKDLYLRPKGFYNSAKNILELLKDLRAVNFFDVYFTTTHTANLDKQPKGIDDLFEAYPENKTEIIEELTTFSRRKSEYFVRLNLAANPYKLVDFLHIGSAADFYKYHASTIKEKEFIYHGTRYKFNEDKNELKIIVPAEAKNYFRVGDNYFEKLMVPNKYGTLEYRYDRRAKATITEDHGKDFFEHVAKYKSFCTKPDHVNYQEVIDNCFNRYKPFEHKPSNNDYCPQSLAFLNHIFGCKEIELTIQEKTICTTELSLGLDYIQLLYQNPTQILPILCLVSKENNTGKSTFGKWMKAIFTGNMATIGNADLESDFNGNWGDKLIICCEESFIDKKKTVEKIKSLSTADKVQINQKGVDQIEVDFFGKFIFMSNNEENFVIANENDERYWVRKVPKFKEEKINMLEALIAEIPNFLCYLNKRNLSTEFMSRMHFHPALLKTDALKKLVLANQSGPLKEMKSVLRNLFLDSGCWQMQMTLKYIAETLLRNKYERSYLEKLMNEKIGVRTAKNTIKYYYPALEFSTTLQQETINIKTSMGRPYTLNAAMFLSEEDLENFELSDEAKFQPKLWENCPDEIINKKILQPKLL